ncbi:MAG: helix-turn-helix domain-containing protein, partial [bacterium]
EDHSTDGEIRAGMSLEEAEKILIEKTLKHYDGNITQSAEKLGVTRKTLRNKKERYEIEV